MSRFVEAQCYEDRDDDEELSDDEDGVDADLKGFVVPDGTDADINDGASLHALWLAQEREQDAALVRSARKRVRRLVKLDEPEQVGGTPLGSARTGSTDPLVSPAVAAMLAKRQRDDAREEAAAAVAAQAEATAKAKSDEEARLRAKIALGLCDAPDQLPLPPVSGSKPAAKGATATMGYRIPKKRC